MPRAAIVLAAGKGTRMRSSRAKVLHEVGGQPLLSWVLAAARAADCAPLYVVVGHEGDRVRGRFEGADDLLWVEQREQLGTGHAAAQAASRLEGRGVVLVVSGDVPLLRATTLEQIAVAAEGGWGAMAVTRLANPGSLGRVVASADGDRLGRIVEAADATAEELAIDLVNAGLYALPVEDLRRRLEALRPHNAQGELYLTDVLTAAAEDGEQVALVELADPEEALGVNTRQELAAAHRVMLRRKSEDLQGQGVTILDPARTVIEPGVRVAPDTVIHPDVSLLGATRVGAGCTLHQGSWLRDTRLDEEVVVEAYSVLDGAEVGAGSRVGPFARLRPGARLGADCRIGNFVEVKNSELGAGSKVNHLAYVGDATVGAEANLGAGVVTCNYDGARKHRTVIGRKAFIGSDTMLVAPVEVGDEATTGAGSVITEDVPPGALGVSRARQRTIEGWTRRRRRGAGS